MTILGIKIETLGPTFVEQLEILFLNTHFRHNQDPKRGNIQPLIGQVVHLKKVKEVCAFHHTNTSTVRHTIKNNPGNHTV